MYQTNPTLELQLFRIHQQQLEKRLEIARQLAEARVARPGLAEQLLAGMGSALIALGQRLKERSAESLDYAPECG